jgi:hypothetical protein
MKSSYVSIKKHQIQQYLYFNTTENIKHLTDFDTI